MARCSAFRHKTDADCKRYHESPVVAVGPYSTLDEVCSLLVTRCLSAVAVIDRGVTLGIVSEEDLVHRAEIGTAAPRHSWWRSGGLTAAIAATLLLAVGIRQFVRAGAEREITRGEGNGVAVVAPGDAVDAGAPVTFTWRPVPGATRYAIDLSDVGGTAVFETSTRDTTVALPAAVALRPGAEYRWIVRATDDAGAPRGTAVRRLAVRAR